MHYDYIVVGSGPGGSALAWALACKYGHSVLVLERGPHQNCFPWMHSAYGIPRSYDTDEAFAEEWSLPQPGLHGRHILIRSPNVVGGGTSVNGATLSRGLRSDYSSWPSGYQWELLLPYFEQVEAVFKPQQLPCNSLMNALADAVSAQGCFGGDHGYSDLRSGASPAAGYQTMAIKLCGAYSQRLSAYSVFLQPAIKTGRVTLCSHSMVQRILFGAHRRAIGVALTDGRKLRADREICVCAGALGSPRLLMRSGIGPSSYLCSQGIVPLVHSGHMGAHLKDQLELRALYRTHKPVPIFQCSYGRPPLRTLPLLAYQAWMNDIRGRPILQFYMGPGTGLHQFAPSALVGPGLTRHLLRLGTRLPLLSRYFDSSFLILPTLARPSSEGSVSLSTVDPGYLRSSEDVQHITLAGQMANVLAYHPAMVQQWTAGSISAPPTETEPCSVEEWARSTASTAYHLTSSCRMGESSDSSVVDTAFRVWGTTDLRVVDSSVFPDITSSSNSLTIMALGLKAADLMCDSRV